MALKLDKLTVEELNDVIAQAQQRKLQAHEEKKQLARDRIDAILAETGFALDELYAGRRGRKSTKPGQSNKSKMPPMFRNPDNARETWSGYGRKPRWFANAINRGMREEDLAVGASKRPAAAKKARATAKPGKRAPKVTKVAKRR